MPGWRVQRRLGATQLRQTSSGAGVKWSRNLVPADSMERRSGHSRTYDTRGRHDREDLVTVPTLDDIRAARRPVYDALRPTPLAFHPLLAEALGLSVRV